MSSDAPPVNRFEIDEKNAIIALQSILTARGPIPEEKYQKFSLFLSRLPPHRAILVYAYAMQAIANRMDEDDPHRDALKKLGQTITENVTPDFADRIERNPDSFESQRQLLAENLKQMATFMAQFQDNDKAAS